MNTAMAETLTARPTVERSASHRAAPSASSNWQQALAVTGGTMLLYLLGRISFAIAAIAAAG